MLLDHRHSGKSATLVLPSKPHESVPARPRQKLPHYLQKVFEVQCFVFKLFFIGKMAGNGWKRKEEKGDRMG